MPSLDVAPTPRSSGPFEAEERFEPDVRSPQAARSFLQRELHGWGIAEVSDVAQVLVSELVTNAVLHAGTTSTVKVNYRAGAEAGVLRVEVADSSVDPPQMHVREPGATSGRGL